MSRVVKKTGSLWDSLRFIRPGTQEEVDWKQSVEESRSSPRMILRAQVKYEGLGVLLLLKSRAPDERVLGPAWTVGLHRCEASVLAREKGSTKPLMRVPITDELLHTWVFALEEQATRRYHEVETMLTLLEAIEGMRRGAH
jgi:hypothetical protein